MAFKLSLLCLFTMAEIQIWKCPLFYVFKFTGFCHQGSQVGKLEIVPCDPTTL